MNRCEIIFHYVVLTLMFQNMFDCVSIDERRQQLCCALLACVCAQDSLCLVRVPVEIIDGALMPVKTAHTQIFRILFSKSNRQFAVVGAENYVHYFIH